MGARRTGSTSDAEPAKADPTTRQKAACGARLQADSRWASGRAPTVAAAPPELILDNLAIEVPRLMSSTRAASSCSTAPPSTDDARSASASDGRRSLPWRGAAVIVCRNSTSVRESSGLKAEARRGDFAFEPADVARPVVAEKQVQRLAREVLLSSGSSWAKCIARGTVAPAPEYRDIARAATAADRERVDAIVEISRKRSCGRTVEGTLVAEISRKSTDRFLSAGKSTAALRGRAAAWLGRSATCRRSRRGTASRRSRAQIARLPVVYPVKAPVAEDF